MAPGGEEAAFVMLAARDRDAQAIERRAGGGRGAHRTGVAANPVDDEAIPITAMAAEARNFDVDRMRQFGPGQRDRKRVVWGKSVSVRVDLGGRSIIKKK